MGIMLGKLRTSSALPPLNETPNLGAFIVLNDDLEWSRGKRAAHAAHALLGLYGITYTHAVRVLNAKPRDLEHCDIRIPDPEHRYAVSRDYDSDSVTVYIASRKSDTRDLTATLAARAAVFLYTGELFERVEIHSATAELVRQQRVVIRDQGRTEIPRGSVTAGASWTA